LFRVAGDGEGWNHFDSLDPMVGPVSQSAERGASDPRQAPMPGPNPPTPQPSWTSLSPAKIAVIILGGALVALFAFLAVATVVEHHLYSGRVLPGVDVDGVSSAGKHEVAVYDGVARLGVNLANAPVRVRIGNQELSASPSLLDLDVDAHATADDAMHDGRGGNFFGQMAGTILRRMRPDHVNLTVDYDENRLEGMLDGWEAETNKGMVEGGLRFDGTKVVAIAPHSGTGILRPRARAALQTMLTGSTRPVLTLPVGTLTPQVDAKAVARAATRARHLLRGNVTIVTGPHRVVIEPAQLAAAMGTATAGHTLRVTLDGARLHAAIGPKLAPFESPPVDASFAVTEQNTVNVVPSKDGREIDVNKVTTDILRGERRIMAPLQDVVPRRNTKWAQALGIKRQVSSFTTDYPPGEARVTNIHRGADLLNNTIVEPGKVFSLNDTVGPRTAARGFVTAPVFASGEFFDDYGGGVSQLATTTYNAGFFAGYADVTHQPHTIYISRYPAGREATVNYGVIDLQFRDDSPHGVLIRTYYSDTSITVALYGDTDGRTAREENRTMSNPVAVTDATFQCPASKTVDPNDVCATLAPGEKTQVSTGDAGFDVAFDRVIDQPGKPERREHYTWHYTMLPNQFLVGSDSTTSTAPGASTSTPPANATTSTPSASVSTEKPTTANTPPTSANAGNS
jgi:vancomycin resistance protein YoaR